MEGPSARDTFSSGNRTRLGAPVAEPRHAPPARAGRFAGPGAGSSTAPDSSRSPLGAPGLGAVRRTLREVGLALVTAGVVILLFVVYQLFGTGIAEAHSQANLKKQFVARAQQLAGGSGAGNAGQAAGGSDNPTLGGETSPSTPTSGAIDHLVIPRMGLSKYVVQGVAENDLREGPGHYPGTVMPGQDGNAAIAGHRTTYGAPFFELNELAVGDPIYVTDLLGRTFEYKVSQPPVVVSPSDLAVLDPTPYAQLTLTTCNPRFSATSRLVVFARLVGRKPLPVPPQQRRAPSGSSPGAPAVALAGDSLGSGDSHAWPPTIGYGLLVIALWVGARLWINRTRKWARVLAYVAGIGICLVPLWFCFENVILLLPQSI